MRNYPVYINRDRNEKLELSPNWKSLGDEKNFPEYDEVVLVLYCSSCGPIWICYDITVAKYKGEWNNWVNCLDLNDDDLKPLYWRPMPGIMD